MSEVGEARLDIVKIDASHCYRCGKLFGIKRKKTHHHTIPKFLNPKRNVKVPICEKCHKEINKYIIQQIPEFKSLCNFIENLEDLIKKHKPKLEKYKKGKEIGD